jgi:hypothetical protein
VHDVPRRDPGPRSFAIGWPERYPQPGSHFFATQLREGLRRTGEAVDVTVLPQPEGPVVIASVRLGDRVELVALDHGDEPEVVEAIVGEVLVYFKQQYAMAGYPYDNVVPAGYMPANNRIYRLLPLLRAVRTHAPARYDVYGRFGLRYGGQELRQRAVELLSARDDLRHGVSLFRYPGGPDKVPYRRYLLEVARAKVCVDMPGNGDLTTRLIDYLAIGSCVVKPPPQARLPVRLVDGVHVVYCAPDLSDLADVCAQLVRDDETREAIARNARDYFDRHLHREQLARHHVAAVTDAAAEAVGTRAPAAAPRPLDHPLPPPRRARNRVLATLAVVFLLLVAVPEVLGDRPYNAIGRDTSRLSVDDGR